MKSILKKNYSYNNENNNTYNINNISINKENHNTIILKTMTMIIERNDINCINNNNNN